VVVIAAAVALAAADAGAGAAWTTAADALRAAATGAFVEAEATAVGASGDAPLSEVHPHTPAPATANAAKPAFHLGTPRPALVGAAGPPSMLAKMLGPASGRASVWAELAPNNSGRALRGALGCDVGGFMAAVSGSKGGGRPGAGAQRMVRGPVTAG
jgi:hypothetical protein